MENELIESRDASDLAEYHYTEYGIVVNRERALSSIYDGFKLVQRRIIYEANKLPLGLTKSVNLVGNAIKLHPHGDSSIYGAIVGMANPLCNLKLFKTKGNWGGYGFGAAASRYTECSLSNIAKFMYCQFIDYAPMKIGEIGLKEPEYLPCLIPYSLINGTSGIGIGLASDRVPFDLMDLIDYYIYYLKNGKFSETMIIKPDFGSMIIDMEDDECRTNVLNYSGTFFIKSLVKQESDTVIVIESLYGKSIDKVLAKLSKKYLSQDRVDFRDESKSSERYVFEIIDNSVNVKEFIKDLENATYKRCSSNTVFDINGKSSFCPLNYVIKKQLEVLNAAIDRKLEDELNKLNKSKAIYELLNFYKSEGIFENITKKTKDELLSDMKNKVRPSSIAYNESLDIEIVNQLSIRYLTKSRDSELISINNKINEIETHNRTEYLIRLYEELKSMVSDFYYSRKHSILKSNLMVNPKIKLITDSNSQSLMISDKIRSGIKFDSYVYLIGNKGTVYRRSISIASKETIPLDYDEKIVGISSDKYRFIKIFTGNNYGIVFDTHNYKWDKRILNLSENEFVVNVTNHYEDEDLLSYTRSKICKPFRI